MKILFWTGVAVLILGIGSLVVPVPRSERESFTAYGVSVGVGTGHARVVSPLLSAVLILGGLGTMVAGKRVKT